MPLLLASATSHGKDVDYVFQKQIIDTLKRYDVVKLKTVSCQNTRYME